MTIFKELIYQGIQAGQVPARTAEARDWYRDAASQLSGLTTSKMMKSFEPKKKVAQLHPGMMYLFKYDPKLKMELPYYDTFPLIFPVELHSDGFLGINFHYLPPMLRAKLMNAIYSTVTDKKYDEHTKIKISYSLLKAASKYKEYKPTIKKYLYNHVKSPFLEITSVEWDIALFLPIEKFKKATAQQVWADSRKKI